MEPQLTDFENAAFIVFAALLVVSVLAAGQTDFRIPISCVDANFELAQENDAVARRVKMSYRSTATDRVHQKTLAEIVTGEVRVLTYAALDRRTY